MDIPKMYKIALIITVVIIVSFAFYIAKFETSEENQKIIKVGIPAYWGTVVPSLQHTAYADIILSNQFEPLVKIGHDGTINPSAAKSWSISPDYRILTFKIDTSKQFSDGTKLKALHFKEAWEYGVKLAPKSSNNNLMDILYKVEGFQKGKDDIPGLVVIDEETFQVRFEKPFRMGLEYLAGIRIAVFLKKGDEYLGTGPYVIREAPNKKLILTANSFANPVPNIKKFEIVQCPADKASDQLKQGELDIYYFAQLATVEECLDDSSNIGCWMGQETHHVILAMNGKSDTFFANKNYRQAINYLIHKKLNTENLPRHHRINKMKIDPQFYLPFQSGRLEEAEVSELLKVGEKWIQEMIKATHVNPIRIVTSEPVNWIQELLEKEGMKFSNDSGWISTPDRFKIFYKTSNADILVGGVGVALGDPDGLYHALGKNGAILSPMVYREKVGQLLEEGRAILEHDQLHEHYKKVSQAILDEVPFVHLGFAFGNTAYRKDRLKISLGIKNREEEGLYLFSLR